MPNVQLVTNVRQFSLAENRSVNKLQETMFSIIKRMGKINNKVIKSDEGVTIRERVRQQALLAVKISKEGRYLLKDHFWC